MAASFPLPYPRTPGTASAMTDRDVVDIDLAGIDILYNPVKAA
jgi:hypothetical protein